MENNILRYIAPLNGNIAMKKLDLLGHNQPFIFGMAIATAIWTLLDFSPPRIAGMIVSAASLWTISSVMAIYVTDKISIEESVKFRHSASIVLIYVVSFFLLIEGILSMLRD